jgi:L-ascorbate metabolism protein UlaG (beta-lactamase superfamily)
MQRKEFLASVTTAGVGGQLVTIAPSLASAPIDERSLTVQYLGTAGWIVRSATATILIDPYVSRINGPPPPGVPQYTSPGDTRPIYHWDDRAIADERAIEKYVPAADIILVTHTHYDHVLDVPLIALKTNVSVIGTESTQNVMRAYGVPERQLITVRGGEDYDFGAFSVRVLPSLHSALDHKHYFSSATAPSGLKAPLTLRQIHPEGGTLAFLVRVAGASMLVFGSMNYIEREIDGLRPDIVIAGAGSSRREIYQYTKRLMSALGNPSIVLPTHWDNFLAPYEASQRAAITALQAFVNEVRDVSPTTRIVVPRYFEPIES